MILEIAGARLIIPEFGGTIYVWGSSILVVLGGLSLGYLTGGKLSDKYPKEKPLSLILIIAGILILVIPITYSFIYPYISLGNYSSLAIFSILFFIPSCLLGMVSPYALKLNSKEHKKIGNTSGKLYAIATFGSLLGTFLVTFVLFRLININQIFYGVSLSLFLISIPLKNNKYVFAGKIILSFISILLIFNLMTITAQDENIINSEYGTVEVRDSGDIRSLFINGGVMGGMDLNNYNKVAEGWEYISCMENSIKINNPKETLMLGIGAGMLPKRLKENNINVEGVDINKEVIRISKEYFYVKDINLIEDDARMYLKNSEKKYDIIFMDILKYDDGAYTVPFHLATKEYFELIEQDLNDEGFFMAMFSTRDNPTKFYEYEFNTLKSVFNNVYALDCGTKLIIASNNQIIFPEELENKLFEYEPKNNIIFTDDYAPLSFLN